MWQKRSIETIVFVALTTLIFCSSAFAQDNLMVYSGGAFKKPLDEIISIYEKKTGTKLYVNYGAVKTIMSQAMLAKKGDLFIVPSPDIMDKMVENDIVKKESIKNFSYQVPVILVQKGNPKRVNGLKDLLRSDVRVAIANPETVYIGMLSVEIFDKHLTSNEREVLKKKLVTYADDISKLMSYLVMNQADAIVGFDFLLGWNPDKAEVVKLNSSDVVRIGVGQVGILSYTSDSLKAKRFIDFLVSPEGQSIFKKYGYITNEKDAYNYIGKKTLIGGTPKVSIQWLTK